MGKVSNPLALYPENQNNLQTWFCQMRALKTNYLRTINNPFYDVCDDCRENRSCERVSIAVQANVTRLFNKTDISFLIENDIAALCKFLFPKQTLLCRWTRPCNDV